MYRPQPPDKLREAVLLSIRKMERRRARLYFAIASSTLCASLIGFVSSIQYFARAFYGSEFYSYATLVFSDSDVVSKLWRDIGISLAESLPVFSIAACLLAIGILLASVRVMAATVKAAFKPSFRV